jgi:hypothetical protein
MAAAAVLAGVRSIAAIAESAADAPQPVRAAPGWSPSTARPCAVPTQTAGGDGRPGAPAGGEDHTSRTVLAQRQVGYAHEGSPAFAPLMAGLDFKTTGEGHSMLAKGRTRPASRGRCPPDPSANERPRQGTRRGLAWASGGC